MPLQEFQAGKGAFKCCRFGRSVPVLDDFLQRDLSRSWHSIRAEMDLHRNVQQRIEFPARFVNGPTLGRRAAEKADTSESPPFLDVEGFGKMGMEGTEECDIPQCLPFPFYQTPRRREMVGSHLCQLFRQPVDPALDR